MGAKRKYNVPANVTGVYSIECKINGKKYIGASVCVNGRISQHMAKRTAEKFKRLPFYADVLKYGYSGFDYILLEECEREELLQREQFYYDLLKPEYNIVRPCKCMFKNRKVRELAVKSSSREEVIEARKKRYNSPKYKELFRNVHINKMKSVEMYKDGVIVLSFKSMQEASRWLTENTTFKGKNKTSKIKSVCDGERPTAYGYKFKYSTEGVTTIPKGSTPAISTQVEAVN